MQYFLLDTYPESLTCWMMDDIALLRDHQVPFLSRDNSQPGCTICIPELTRGSAVLKDFGQSIPTSTSTLSRPLGPKPSQYIQHTSHVVTGALAPTKLTFSVCFSFTTKLFKWKDLTKMFVLLLLKSQKTAEERLGW